MFEDVNTPNVSYNRMEEMQALALALVNTRDFNCVDSSGDYNS